MTNPRIHPMGAMMARLGVDVTPAGRDGLFARIEAVVRNCRFCRQTAACHAWLECGHGDRHAFCPNARDMDALAR